MTAPARFNPADTKPDRPGYYVVKQKFLSPVFYWDGQYWHTVRRKKGRPPAPSIAIYKSQALRWRKFENEFW